MAGACLVAGFDQWDLAGRVYRDNFPGASFYQGALELMNPAVLGRRLGGIDLLLASPECTNHSPAKGAHPRCERSRDTAFQVTRFAEALKPRWVVVENVVNMRSWSRYAEFVDSLRDLDYEVKELTLNAVDFGVPQSRRRLFLMCDSERQPSDIRPVRRRASSVRSVLQRRSPFAYSPLHSTGRALATLERAGRAIRTLGEDQEFILVYYGSDGAGGWQSVDTPLRTVTTLDRFAHVKPSSRGHVMRMLQVPELQTAMGLPKAFRLTHGSRRDRIRLLGNAVCPPVMMNIVKTLLNRSTEKGIVKR